MLDLAERTKSAVDDNLSTPCIRNARSLLITALAAAHAGDVEAAAEIEERGREVATEGYDAILAAPLARPLGVPVVLWFAHWRGSLKLRLAERLATRVLSVSETSFPLPSRKLATVGHGVDLSLFLCRDGGGDGDLRLVSLGRYSPSKNYPELVRGVLRARNEGVPVTLDVYGPTLTADERRHRAELEQMRGAGIELHEGVPGSDVPAVLARYDAFASATRAGSADKAILEAAAACLPVVAATPPIDTALSFHGEDQLAARLGELAHLPADERRRLGREGRARVEQLHSLDAWADRVLAAIA
jgi:glycosyltransferase involved in cell wall biosynthesis